MRIEYAGGLAALVDDRAELIREAGRLERTLPVVFVQVELAALSPGLRRPVSLVNRDREPVDVQDAGEREAAEPGADDRDGSVNRRSCAGRGCLAGSRSRLRVSRDVQVGSVFQIRPQKSH